MSADYEQVEVASREDWRAWLSASHQTVRGAWVVTFKKGDDRHVPYDAIAEEALCFGWIDSKPRKLDAERSQLLVTPRKPGSKWSRVNKQRVERLQAAGLMTRAGMRVVAAAQSDGSWTALDDVENLIEPDDLAAALEADPDARAHWDAFPRSTRRGILEWIANARRPQTREKRVAETAAAAARNIRANQWRQPKR